MKRVILTVLALASLVFGNALGDNSQELLAKLQKAYNKEPGSIILGLEDGKVQAIGGDMFGIRIYSAYGYVDYKVIFKIDIIRMHDIKTCVITYNKVSKDVEIFPKSVKGTIYPGCKFIQPFNNDPGIYLEVGDNLVIGSAVDYYLDKVFEATYKRLLTRKQW